MKCKKYKVGQRIKVQLSDGNKVSGKVYSITEDYWGKKVKKTLNLNVNRGKQTAHFPVDSIIKPKGVC